MARVEESRGILPVERTEQSQAHLLRQAGLLALSAGLLLGWSFFIRAGNEFGSIVWERLLALAVDPYVLGLTAQEMLLPLAMLFLFSRWPLFRRCVRSDAERPLSGADTGRLLAVMIAGQAVLGLYLFWLIRTNNSWVTLALVVAVAAGVLGGWRVGLGVGLAALLTNGLLSYLPWENVEPISWNQFLDWFLLRNELAVTALWAGVAAGLAAPWLRLPPRFALWKLLVVGLGIELFAAFCIFIATDSDAWIVERLLPNLAVSAVAWIALYLMMREVQAEDARQQAESAHLELAQANLALTQTRLALAQAEVRALHAQINPHFLFNSLNTIRYFIRTDPAQARELLTSLSDLFQRALNAGEFVPLRDEINHVEAYLALEQARLDERLQVVWTNLAKDDLDVPVPTLVLQPVVENAILHGIGPRPEGGVIHIVINRVGVDLLVQVDDNGVGFDVTAWNERRSQAVSDAGAGRASIGLRNVDERLRMLYGPDYRLIVESQPGQGTRAVIRVPVQHEPATREQVRQ